MKTPSKIIFSGAVQNSEKYLPAVFRNIENLTKLFSEAAYIFIENDSVDNTKKCLKIGVVVNQTFILLALMVWKQFQLEPSG